MRFRTGVRFPSAPLVRKPENALFSGFLSVNYTFELSVLIYRSNAFFSHYVQYNNKYEYLTISNSYDILVKIFYAM